MADATAAAWDGSASRFSDAQWKASTILDRGADFTSAKERYALPVREPDGTLNKHALAAAGGALNGARGGLKGVAPTAIAAARKKLASLYSQAGMTTATAKADGSVELDVPLWKDDAKQIVYGVVLEPDLMDSQGDTVSASEIETAAHRFLTQYRKHDWQHDESARDSVQTVESYVAPQDIVVGNEPVRKGAWVLATHISDAEDWREVVSKAKTGYSIGGSAVRIAKGENDRDVVLKADEQPTDVAKAAELRNLDVEFVSIVDRAAVRDPGNTTEPRRFLLWKREGDTTDPQGGTMTPEEIAALTAARDAAVAKQAELTESLAKAETDNAALEARVAELEKKDDKPEPASIDKSELPEPVRKALEKAEADAAAANERIAKAEQAAEEDRKLAKAERDARLTSEFVAKAETLKVGKADELGPILKAASETLTAEQYGSLEGVLKAAGEQIATGKLFSETGTGNVDTPTGAYAEATQKAETLQKSDSTLSRPDAMRRVFAEDRELQNRYLAEVR